MEMFEDDLAQQAKEFETNKIEYSNELKKLLKNIYLKYELLIKDKVKIPKNEDKITEILINNYLVKIDGYIFEAEKGNNRGIVDIYIVKDFSDNKPEFIIECKVLDNKNLQGVKGKNAEYIKNGIYRFLNGQYYLDNNFYINAMAGFIVDNLNIVENIDNLNLVSRNIIGELVDITKEITLEEENLYKSTYRTIKEKNFIIYHLMMDFSKNIII